LSIDSLVVETIITDRLNFSILDRTDTVVSSASPWDEVALEDVVFNFDSKTSSMVIPVPIMFWFDCYGGLILGFFWLHNVNLHHFFLKELFKLNFEGAVLVQAILGHFI
jgi:hypothetical protein